MNSDFDSKGRRSREQMIFTSRARTTCCQLTSNAKHGLKFSTNSGKRRSERPDKHTGDVAAQREIRLSVGTVPCLSASREKWTGNYYCSKEVESPPLLPHLPAPILIPVPNIRLEGHFRKCIPEINYNYPGAAQDEYMPQLPDFQAQLNQFPWGRLERDGTFSNKFLQARFDVLDYDYRKINLHDISDDPLFGASVQPFMQPKDNTNLTGYAHGAMMLALEEWPSDVEV
ncbi:hypothetical protein C8J57DRAFT_1250263 [Mycena rebaudengoi]|nr:hypothetical protein C8J57DRAFT_1250263 [Mycena rebaudengoi]